MSTPILVLRNKIYEYRDLNSTKMKDVDRWLFNINMLTRQIDREFPESIALPVYEKITRDWSDNTALRLNEKSTAEALEIFEKFSPPCFDKGLASLKEIKPSDKRVKDEYSQVVKLAEETNSFYKGISRAAAAVDRQGRLAAVHPEAVGGRGEGARRGRRPLPGVLGCRLSPRGL